VFRDQNGDEAQDVLYGVNVFGVSPVRRRGTPGEFTSHVDLTVVGGFGKYAEATGTEACC
jgi:hypothetical protein